MKRWFIPAAARARGQSKDLNRGILASNLFNCHNDVINAPPIPSISRCIHIVYRHKNLWEYQWLNFIYNCMSTFLHYVRCKDALLDCSAPGGERCKSLTWVDEITFVKIQKKERRRYNIHYVKPTGRGCPWQHPKACHKLVLHGTHGHRGWNKGSQCLWQLFPKVGMASGAWLSKTILKVFPEGFVPPILQIGDIDKIMT